MLCFFTKVLSVTSQEQVSQCFGMIEWAEILNEGRYQETKASPEPLDSLQWIWGGTERVWSEYEETGGEMVSGREECWEWSERITGRAPAHFWRHHNVCCCRSLQILTTSLRDFLPFPADAHNVASLPRTKEFTTPFFRWSRQWPNFLRSAFCIVQLILLCMKGLSFFGFSTQCPLLILLCW